MVNPYQVTRDFESALCEYTGAKYAVAVNSCTAALYLAIRWLKDEVGAYGELIEIPRRTYMSVPMAIMRAGARIEWRDEDWRGAYALRSSPRCDYPIIDSARHFTSGMYVSGQYQCVSFSSSKILGIEQGGAILHDDPEADDWLRRARFDGRREGVDPHMDDFIIGEHCIMLPSIAAQALLKLSFLPKHNDDMPWHDYPDLSKQECFR